MNTEIDHYHPTTSKHILCTYITVKGFGVTIFMENLWDLEECNHRFGLFFIMSAKAAEAPLQHILILSAVRVTLPVGIK